MSAVSSSNITVAERAKVVFHQVVDTVVSAVKSVAGKVFGALTCVWVAIKTNWPLFKAWVVNATNATITFLAPYKGYLLAGAVGGLAIGTIWFAVSRYKQSSEAKPAQEEAQAEKPKAEEKEEKKVG